MKQMNLLLTRQILLACLTALLLVAPSLRAADGALQFLPASNQRVEVPNFAGLGISTEVTVEFWVLSTSNSIAQSVFMLNPDTPTNRFQCHLNYFNGNTYWDFGDIGNGGRVQLPNVGTWLNNWTHFALVASQSGGMKIYANGAQVASSPSFNDLDLTALTNQNATLSIGGILGTYFQGKIDDFRVWSIARSQADIQRDLGGPLTGSEPDLKLYFKFDEGSGTTAINSATATGAAYNGTLVNSPTRVASDVPLTYVTNANAFGPGSLRQALFVAFLLPGEQNITFDPALSGGTIMLTGPDNGTAIAIADAGGVTMDATSLPGGLTIQCDSASPSAFRLFSVASGTSLTLRGLTLANGGGIVFGGDGGAINNSGTLTLTHCTLSGNSTIAFGGAINNFGTVTLTHCTLSGNSYASRGGAIANFGTVTLTHCTLSGNSANFGGAIYNNHSTLTLTHCTLSGNSASGTGTGGGGGAISNGGTLTLTHCTLSGNSATGTNADGGGISNNSTLTLTNSIVAGNTATGNGADIYQVATNHTVTATGANIVQTAIFGGTVSGTIANVNPLLAPLADNGGPTKTMALLPGSPALDAAVGSTSTTDQRGLPRSRDGNTTAGAAPDIGAYEAQVAPTGALGFNFNGASPRNLLATDLAGAPGFAQTHWNNLTGDYAILNNSRTLSGGGSATVRTWYDAPNTWAIDFGTPANAEQKLMWGYLDSNGVVNSGPNLYNAENQPFFALADLPSAFTLGGYRVVVYADAEGSATDRVGEYWLTTMSADPSNVTGTNELSPHLFVQDIVNFSGTYTRVPSTSTDRNAAAAGNYLVFENQTQPAFILRTEDNPSFRAVLNAVQVVRNEILVVTTAQDENDPVGTPGNGLSLREAVALAPDGAGIVFDSALSGQTITLGSEILLIGKSLTIDASSLPAGVTIDGGLGTNRIFFTDKTVTLKNLTLTGGGGTGLYASGNGGAINNNGGRLTLERCTLSGNSAGNGGGAIGNSGTLTLTHCTLSGNSASFGGAINSGGGGTLTLTHCTLSGNSAASGDGGAIVASGTLTLTHCTLSGNSANQDGGAIYNTGTLTLTNSIVAGNTATGNGADIFRILGTITPTGVNLIGNLSNSGLFAGPNVIENSTPGLAPLGNYGGPTQTMALLPDSPARNAAVGSSITSDQRGFPIVGGVPDIGAYEAGTLGPNYNAYIYETLPATASYAWNVPVPDAQHATTFDFDGDGVTNGNEWIARTAPSNGADYFRITSAVRSGVNVILTFPSVTGRTYTLWQSDTLTGAWTDTGQTAVSGDGSAKTFTIPAPVNGVPKRFHRVQVGP